MDISFIIPTYRRPHYLAEALGSILKIDALRIEVLVIDDSPDGEGAAVVDRLGDPRIRYSKRPEPSMGRPALLRNEATARAHGAVLHFLDDDDVVIPEGIVSAYAELKAAPAGVVISIPEAFGDVPDKVARETDFFERARARLARHPAPGRLAAHLIFSDSLVTCSACMIKADLCRAIGGFDEAILLGEDTDFYARAIESRGYLLTTTTFARRRVGQASLISDAKRDALDASYSRMRSNFRQRRGALEFFVYRTLFKLARAGLIAP